MWWAALAFGADESVAGLQDWVMVPTLALPDWVRRPSWIRVGAGCAPVAVEDAAAGNLAVRMCAVEVPEGRFGCDVRFRVGANWDWLGERCRLIGPDGRVVAEGLGMPLTSPERLVLVDAAERTARWASAVTLEARAAPAQFEERPCDSGSQKALGQDAKRATRGNALQTAEDWLGAHGIFEGHRRCDVTDALEVVPVVQGTAALVGWGRKRGTEPVDCRERCADNPVLAALTDLSGRLDGATFTARDDKSGPVLFATEAACKASQGTTLKEWPPEWCVSSARKLIQGD